jgi:hypothetical protein
LLLARVLTLLAAGVSSDLLQPFGAATIIPLRAGKTIAWQLADETSAK